MTGIKLLAFDVFGTVVDWRTSIAREAVPFLAAVGRPELDPHAFADGWRGLYQPAMAEVREGRRPFERLDVLNRETLEVLLGRYGIDPAGVGEARLAEFAQAWRRLDPWPDAVAGLTRLKRDYTIVTLSNGNIALMTALARFGGLPWDAILGAEVTGHYKPDDQSYLGTAEIMGLAPAEVCLVAAHHSDLAAARRNGLATAYVARPLEYGGRPAPDLAQRQDWDWSVGSLLELADALAITPVP